MKEAITSHTDRIAIIYIINSYVHWYTYIYRYVDKTLCMYEFCAWLSCQSTFSLHIVNSHLKWGKCWWILCWEWNQICYWVIYYMDSIWLPMPFKYYIFLPVFLIANYYLRYHWCLDECECFLNLEVTSWSNNMHHFLHCHFHFFVLELNYSLELDFILFF